MESFTYAAEQEKPPTPSSVRETPRRFSLLLSLPREKLGDFFKGGKGLGKAIDTIDQYKKLSYVTENAIKNLGITKRGIYTIPIPLVGAGIHVWAGYKFGDVTIVSSGTGFI